MQRRRTSGPWVAGLIIALAVAPAAVRAGDILGYAEDLWDRLGWPSNPPTLTDVARMIDHIRNRVLDQGTVVVKQPDVWSQARMTMFRKEFENTMKEDLNNFSPYLSAQVARSDYASFSSQTALAASISPATPAANAPLQTPADVADERAAAVSMLNSTSTTPTNTTVALPGSSSFPATASNFSLLNAATPAANLTPTTTGALPKSTGLNFGLEPNVVLDEKADYINHLHQLRRINLGDDNADSAGYALYLMRVPVSIQPGDDTRKGFGAIVNITVSHDFSPRFLQATYRNLVIYDLVDLLAPVVHELIRSGKAWDYRKALEAYWAHPRARAEGLARMRGLPPGSVSAEAPETPEESKKLDAAHLPDDPSGPRSEFARNLRLAAVLPPVSRSGQRTYAIAPSDVDRVFVAQNLLNLAFAAQQALDLGKSGWSATWKVRATDVRNYLRHELESAFDLMEGRCKEQPPLLQDVPYIEHLTDQVYCRKFEGPKGTRVDSDREFNEFYTLYERFAQRLPGNLRFRPVGVLCWGIAIQAGLLNRQLREDMKQTKGSEGFACPPDVDGLFFYPPEPGAEAINVFQEYVKARWPIITFALEPVTDQQNIEDAYSRRRDLQLAIAFALSSGRISFRQAMDYTRQLQYEAQTIALNQTISAFAHGHDTFGWRFSPRYQTPPDESNIGAVFNMLIRGGPGPDYQLDNSKIEPGMRELTAVVVMPSFVRAARLDVAGDWFRLHDPDERTVHTARTVELGRKINDTREALEYACQFGNYRREDVERLRARLRQLEAMLPLQTQFVKVPYENTLGGFALFTQGETALVPELSGFEGIESLDTSRTNDIIVFGKHSSLYETAVVVGGVAVPILPDPGGDATSTAPPNGYFSILSREVMRVRIPAGVETATREDGQQVVELYVSTPTGISNRLQIPAAAAQKPWAQAPSPPTPTFSVPTDRAYTFIDMNLTIPISAHLVVGSDKSPVLTFDKVRDFPQGSEIRIQPLLPSPPASIDLLFVYQVGGYSLPVTVPNIKLGAGNNYVIQGDDLKTFANSLCTLIANNNLSFMQPPVNSRPVLIQASGQAGPKIATSAATNTVLVRFDVNLIIPPTPAGQGSSGTQGGAGGAGAGAGGGRASAVWPGTGPDPSRAGPSRPRSVLPVGLPRDPGARKAADDPDRPDDLPLLPPADAPAFQRPVVPAPAPPIGVTGPSGVLPIPTPAPVPVPTVPTIPGRPNPTAAIAATPAVAPAAGGAAAPAQTVVVTPPRGPTVNVSVPITNLPKHPHRGLFHRRKAAPASPAASARGPLLERLLGRP